MNMAPNNGFIAAVVAALLALGSVTPYASARGANSTDVIIQSCHLGTARAAHL
jgi:hypothetical protein